MWRHARRPNAEHCEHKWITTVTAGLERRACEKCGHVTISLAADTFQELRHKEPATASKS